MDEDVLKDGIDTAPVKLKEEEVYETCLRPRRMDEYVGQEKVKENLGIAVLAAKARGEALDHVLFYGPPGLGKTTLAHIIAAELGTGIKTASGPTIEKSGDLAAILTNLESKDVLFIDEIHRLPSIVEEILYPAMEDFKIDIIIGQGPAARSIRLDIPRFTLIGATTRAGLLTAPLRDRFGMIMRLDFYSPDELKIIVMRSGALLGVELTDDGAREIASRSRGTPRLANRILKRVRDYAEVKHDGVVTLEVAKEALAMLEIDSMGFDKMDRRMLLAIIEKFSGGPVGIESLAAALHEEKDSIEDLYEPYLIQEGFIKRTSRGRVATKRAYGHLGLEYPESLADGSQGKLL